MPSQYIILKQDAKTLNHIYDYQKYTDLSENYFVYRQQTLPYASKESFFLHSASVEDSAKNILWQPKPIKKNHHTCG